MDWLSEVLRIRKNNHQAALCTLVRTAGSTPRMTGAKMIVYSDGRISGTIGGGNLEKKVIEEAILQIQLDKPASFEHHLLQEHNMCCGGTVEVYIEPIKRTKKLYIFGAGHVGKALSEVASSLDFDIVVLDGRKEQLEAVQGAMITRLFHDFEIGMPEIDFDENTFVVIMTHDHALDRKILAHCIGQSHAYLGMIGSMRKVAITKKLFIRENIATQEELESVDMPMGIDIKAEGPNEIAISILANLIKVKNGTKSGHRNRSDEGDWEGDCTAPGKGKLSYGSG